MEDTIGDRTERCANVKCEAELGGRPVVRLLLERFHGGRDGFCPEGEAVFRVVVTERHAANTMSLISDDPMMLGGLKLYGVREMPYRIEIVMEVSV